MALSDPFASLFLMQSEQRRQRRKELKRLKREEKRRALERAMPARERIELHRILAPERQAQLCAPGEPRTCAQGEAIPLPPGGERTFWGAMRIARNLLGGRASAAQCIELIARTYLASGRREPD
jgi:hypothetical protein